MTALAQVEDVKAALSVETVLGHFGISYRPAGSEARFATCPKCGERGRADTVAANLLTGLWKDHAHGCSGDIIDLVGGLAGLEGDFRRALELAADMAGVVALPEAPEQLARRRAELVARRAEATRADSERRATAEATAPAIWARLAPRSEPGEAYLAGRGLDRARPLIRFGRHSLCIPLHDATGRLANVVGRRFDGGEPKVRGLAGCGTLGTFGDPRDPAPRLGPVVIVEGLADWLAARIIWPRQTVLGAHGAGRIPDVGQVAAELALGTSRGLLFVPHGDEVGLRQVDRGIAVALSAGVRSEDIDVYDCRAGDLADAWLASVGGGDGGR